MFRKETNSREEGIYFWMWKVWENHRESRSIGAESGLERSIWESYRDLLVQTRREGMPK